MRLGAFCVSILLGLTSVASAEDWSQFIEKPGDKVPVSKPAPVATPAPAKQAKKPAAKQVASKQKVKARAKPKARHK
jgi:hypothetical protein